MSIVDIGNQQISHYYQAAATASNFNRLLRDILKPGIFTGGQISIVSANDIQVAPFHAFLRSSDVGLDKAVHIQTLQIATLTIPNAPNQEYIIYLTYSYLPNLTNYADFNIRTAASPAVPNEVRLGKVTNDGSGNLLSVTYHDPITATYFKDWGTIDVDNADNLTTSANPTQDYHVGNRLFNDYRYVNHNGTNNWDVEILNSADGTLASKLKAILTSSRTWLLQDRDMTLADDRAAFQVGDIKTSLATITPSDATPWLDISVDYVTLNSSGASSWPLLVPFLRGLGTTGYVVTGYTPGVSTILQMDSGDPATVEFVLALYQDNLYHGSGVENYANYKTLTVSTAFGTDIPVGEYNILDVDPILYTIEIDASTVGPSAAGNVDHYPFRIKASTTTARWFRVEDSSFVSVGGENMIPMFRTQDHMQKHSHTEGGHTHQFFHYDIATFNLNAPGLEHTHDGNGSADSPNLTTAYVTLGDPTNSGTGAGVPRLGNTTRPRSFVVRKYLYGGRFDV